MDDIDDDDEAILVAFLYILGKINLHQFCFGSFQFFLLINFKYSFK